jgi:hypothetical protein
MKKQFIIEWIILLALLIILVPFVTVKISHDEEHLLRLFSMVIRYVAPASVIILLSSQLWRKRNKEKSKPGNQHA